uniref:Uncharacterized protein n=1 Tax=Salix viminalis TaxID=40686 RepID=A0A6N2N360_SALVM
MIVRRHCNKQLQQQGKNKHEGPYITKSPSPYHSPTIESMGKVLKNSSRPSKNPIPSILSSSSFPDPFL